MGPRLEWPSTVWMSVNLGCQGRVGDCQIALTATPKRLRWRMGQDLWKRSLILHMRWGGVRVRKLNDAGGLGRVFQSLNIKDAMKGPVYPRARTGQWMDLTAKK